MKSYPWLLVMTVCGVAAQSQAPARLTARVFKSGFALSHDTYNGMSCASNGKIYYVLCSESIDTGAQMYSYDPATDKIEHLGDLTEASGEKGLKAIPQGKSHVSFVESNGKLYFATHVGYYTIRNGMEKMGMPPPGYKPYPGGHFLSYDMATGKFENLVTAPAGEGILAMSMDTKRGRLYGLTWPSGYFLLYDLQSRELEEPRQDREGRRGWCGPDLSNSVPLAGGGSGRWICVLHNRRWRHSALPL